MMNTCKIYSVLTSFSVNPLAKENNFLASKQALYNIIRYNEKPGRGVENRHYARAFFTLLLFLLCLPLAAQEQKTWQFKDGNSLNISNEENTNHRVTGSFNDEQGGAGGSSAINIRGGKHEMTFSDVRITMSKRNSEAMNLENTILNLELEGQNNTITYGRDMEGINLDKSSLFISGEGRLTITSNVMPPGFAISGVESTVAITGGTIGLSGQRIQMVRGTLIIGPEANVQGIALPSLVYDAGFVFENGEASVKGDPELPVDLTIPEGYTLNVPAGTSLTVPEGVTLTVEGAIRVETGGSITGSVSGTVQHELTEDMVDEITGIYIYTGEAIEPEVTINGYTLGEDYTVDYADNINAGTATITIKQTKEGKLYGEVTKSFPIERANPEYIVPTNLTATYGEILEDVALPAGWTWEDNTLSVGEVGDNTFTAIFTPADTENYNTITQKVTITVEAKES